MADGTDLSGTADQNDVAPGIFVCAVGCLLPLFLTEDLSSTTASSGWIIFYQPILDNHVLLVPPPVDNRGGGGVL